MDSSHVISSSHLDSTFGCLFLGGIFTSILWGVGCLQLWLYYEKHSKADPCWLKVYVFVIWALDVAHQTIIVQTLYTALVRGIADPTLLGRDPKPLIFVALITGLVDGMVQSIFLRRVWYITKRNVVVTGMLCAIVLGQFAATMTYFIQTFNFTVLTQLATVVHTEFAMNCITAVTDTCLACTLIYFLWKGRTGFRKTNNITNRLIAYTIGTGLITALCAIAALIGAQVAPESFFYILIDVVVPKLYFNCMLASLNARSSLREIMANEADDFGIRLGDSMVIGGSSSSSGLPRKALVTVSVERGGDVSPEPYLHVDKKFGSRFYSSELGHGNRQINPGV